MKLITGKNPLLNKILSEVSEDSLAKYGITLDKLKKELKTICEDNEGTGLAANQIGYDLAIFYINVNGPKWYINPEIIGVDFSQKLAFPEGCLSFPGETVMTKRSTKIKIAHAGGPDETLSGVEAIVFQHELDHLHGITMHERKI